MVQPDHDERRKTEDGLLIIVEGPDGAGKSTLVDRLATQAGNARVLHRGPPAPDKSIISAYTAELTFYEPAKPINVICDRWHLGELVYGPLLRGANRLGAEELWDVEYDLTYRGAVMVLVHEEAPELERRLKKRGDALLEKYPHVTVQHLLDGYRRARWLSRLPMIQLQPSLHEGQMAQRVTEIINVARVFEQSAAETFWRA